MLSILKRKGIRGIFAAVEEMDSQIDIPAFYDFIIKASDTVFYDSEREQLARADLLTLNWVIPEMGEGSGGHINIFRFMQMLQQMGVKNRLYLFRCSRLDTDKKLKDFIGQYYDLDTEQIEISHTTDGMKPAHAVIATSWQTAYFVKNFQKSVSKFYFVQDFEPYFYAAGSEYLFAEHTYRFGLRGLTAGDWLRQKLSEEYGMQADSFLFSYNKNIYYPGKKRDDVKRLFFYARPVTPRRAFELGLLALAITAETVKDIEVVFAGWDVGGYKIPFRHKNAGSLRPEQLSDMYAQCDMCLVLSCTNLSLLPLEIMASNSVAVCTKGENSSWLVNEENAVLTDTDPRSIADTLVYYLQHREKLDEIRRKGLAFAQSSSWEAQARKVYGAIKKGVEEDGKNQGIDYRGKWFYRDESGGLSGGKKNGSIQL